MKTELENIVVQAVDLHFIRQKINMTVVPGGQVFGNLSLVMLITATIDIFLRFLLKFIVGDVVGILGMYLMMALNQLVSGIA